MRCKKTKENPAANGQKFEYTALWSGWARKCMMKEKPHHDVMGFILTYNSLNFAGCFRLLKIHCAVHI